MLVRISAVTTRTEIVADENVPVVFTGYPHELLFVTNTTQPRQAAKRTWTCRLTGLWRAAVSRVIVVRSIIGRVARRLGRKF